MVDNPGDGEIRMSAGNLYRRKPIPTGRSGAFRYSLRSRRTDPPIFRGSDCSWARHRSLRRRGALPLSFEIEAKSLEEAIGKFGDSAQTALAGTMERIEEMRREAASSIIVPGSDPMAAPGGGLQVR